MNRIATRTAALFCALAVAAPSPAQSPEAAPAASVRSMPLQRALDAAREIDALVERDLRRHEVQPNPKVDDATFVRRAYLQIIGRIPTAVETEAYLRDRASGKRAALIDRLLDAPGHASHEFNYWADLLRVKSRLANQVSGEPYIHWLKQAIADNVPYDELVTELLTASGPAHARDNGSTGYYLRDRGMPEDNMANTVRVFLGTRLECAQCHDHPFDSWKQRDFFGMAAFTGGLTYQIGRRPGEAGVRDLRPFVAEVRKKHGNNGARSLGRLLRPLRSGIQGSGKGVTRLPKDYQYDDAKPGQVVEAATMFGEAVDLDVVHPRQTRRAPRANRPRPRRGQQALPYKEIHSRAAYAEWMTSPDNPRFTQVIANRLWKRVMGRGVIEPVDDLKEGTAPANPELMAYLERLMFELDYDLEQFQRVLFNTTLFARQASQCDPVAGEVYRFAGPVLQRMTAEQIWDSMLTLAVPDLDAKLQAPDARAERVYEAFERFLSSSDDELMERVDREVLRYTDPEKYRQLQRAARRKQIGERNAMRQRDQSAQGELRKQARALRQALAKARRAKDKDEIADLQRQQRELAAKTREVQQRGRRRARESLVRASDMPSPSPDGHFLRRFGQSDREQIEAADDAASVPQVLTLLNGFVETRILGDSGAVLTQALAAAKSPKEKIRSVYLSVLNREPRSDEMRMWSADVRASGAAAYRDMVWTLVNTHEFRFVQ